MKTRDLSGLDVCGILCISLKERSDRREILLKEFADTGLEIEFVLVDKDQESPQRGCLTSHQKCALIAKERGYKRVLILEDDAKLIAFDCKTISNINKFIGKQTFDLFYLGATLGKVWLTWNRGIARARVKGTFAYIASSRVFDRILSLEFERKAIDSLYSKIFKSYMSVPMIIDCQPEVIANSDIVTEREGMLLDEEFWKKNYAKTYKSIRSNLVKTIFRIDL